MIVNGRDERSEPSYRPPHQSRSVDRSHRRALLLSCVALPLLLTIGGCAFWPGIVDEAKRREPWEVALTWSGDAVAVFWYLWFIAGWATGVHTLRNRPLTPAEGHRVWRAVALSMIIGAAIDAGATGWVYYAEKAGYAAATVTVARGRCFKRQEWSAATHFHLICIYTDQYGHAQELRVVAVDMREKGPPRGYPMEVVSALRRGAVEFPIGVRYDPNRPDRAWIDGSGGIDENGYIVASLGVLLFQTLVLGIVAAKFLPLLRASARRGVLPWWVDLIKLAPLTGEAICVGLFGVLELLLNR